MTQGDIICTCAVVFDILLYWWDWAQLSYLDQGGEWDKLQHANYLAVISWIWFLSLNDTRNPQRLDCDRSIPATHGVYKNPQHLDVVDRQFSAESGIVLSPMRCRRFVVSFTNKIGFNLKTPRYQRVAICLTSLIQIRKRRVVAHVLMVTKRTVICGAKLVMPFTKTPVQSV